MILSGVKSAARNTTIKVAGAVATGLIVSAHALKQNKADVEVKNGKTFIHPTRDDEDYCGENVIEIVKELSGAGFDNIEIKPVKTLGRFSAKKYGQVNAVSINGKKSFSTLKKFLDSSFIIIEYLDFKDSAQLVGNITPGKWNGRKIEPYHLPESINNSDNDIIYDAGDGGFNNNINDISINYCSNCGAKIENTDDHFCASCGQSIR